MPALRGRRVAAPRRAARRESFRQDPVVLRQHDPVGTAIDLTVSTASDPEADRRATGREPASAISNGVRPGRPTPLQRDRRRHGASRATTERTIGEQRMPFASQYRGRRPNTALLPDAQLDLHRRDPGDLPRLFDLSHGHVAEADRLDMAVALQRVQRANAGGQRNPRIRRMELVKVDAVNAERPAAGLARGRQVPRATVGGPPPFRPGQAAFRGDDARASDRPPRCRVRARSAARCVRSRSLLTVRVGGVEERDAGVERRVEHRDAPRPDSDRARGQAHAAHPDAPRSGWPDESDHDRGLMGESRLNR